MTPIVVDDVEGATWDHVADVVVVGFGGAGASAALQARESGAETILIDRFGGGGTTKYSGGVIYAGATRFQREAGIEDSVENMIAYLEQEVGDAVRPETLRRYCEGSAADLDWLIGHGVRYDSSAYLEKITYPPEGKYLYYSGNEKSPAFAAHAVPAARGHRAVGPGFGGAHYIAALRAATEREGVRQLLHTRVARLIVDPRGRTVGVEAVTLPEALHARHQALYETANPYVPHNHAKTGEALGKMAAMEERDGRVIRIRARGGVILSAGGYAYDPAEVGRTEPLLGRYYKESHRLSTMGNDGSALAMATGIGAATGYMNSIYIARNMAPPEALLEGILVNARGERFVAEDAYVSYIGRELAAQPDGKAWLILPARTFRRSIKDALTCGWQRMKYFGAPMLLNYLLGGTRRGGTAARLARKAGIDPATLEATIAAHDAAIANGASDAVGKTEELRRPIGAGALYAVNMSMANRHALTKFMTLGGLKVDEDSGAVLRADGSAIAGLYAAGMTAVGLHSNGYISGLSLGDGVFSGRRAGRSAATASGPKPANRPAEKVRA
jgi:3-oxo-5alpha-steroid 4-dehydrogenase